MYAIQPKAWGRLDPHGCDYATNMTDAYDYARQWNEDCTIWKEGTEAWMNWMYVTDEQVSSAG